VATATLSPEIFGFASRTQFWPAAFAAKARCAVANQATSSTNIAPSAVEVREVFGFGCWWDWNAEHKIPWGCGANRWPLWKSPQQSTALN